MDKVTGLPLYFALLGVEDEEGNPMQMTINPWEAQIDEKGNPVPVTAPQAPEWGETGEFEETTTPLNPTEMADIYFRALDQGASRQDAANDLALALERLGLDRWTANEKAQQFAATLEQEQAQFEANLEFQRERLTAEIGMQEAENRMRILTQALSMWPTLSLAGQSALRDMLASLGIPVDQFLSQMAGVGARAGASWRR